MTKKKLIEIGGAPSPIKHPSLGRVRLFLDIFVIILVLISFLLFIFVKVPSSTFLGVLVFCALYTYLARRFI